MPNTLYDGLFAPHRRSARIFLHLQNGETLTHEAFATADARPSTPT